MAMPDATVEAPNESIETPAAEAPPAAKAAPEPAKLSHVALRDLALVLAGLSLWAAADTWYVVTGLGLSSLVSTLNGLLAGAALGGLLHEWGHFAGARLSGSQAPLAPAGGFFPMFNFDMQANSSGQFQAMSVGGNLAHWLTVLALVLLLPLNTPGRMAIVSGAFGFAVFASTTEFPVIYKVASGTGPMPALATVIGKLQRNGWIGAAAAIALFLVL